MSRAEYSVQIKGITVSQIFCELFHSEMLVLDLEKSDF
jgi:hypothetical protein